LLRLEIEISYTIMVPSAIVVLKLIILKGFTWCMVLFVKIWATFEIKMHLLDWIAHPVSY